MYKSGFNNNNNKIRFQSQIIIKTRFLKLDSTSKVVKEGVGENLNK